MADVVDHGKLLTEFLESEWSKLGTTRGEWCRKAGLSDTTVLRWNQGVTPDLRNLRLVADALKRSLIDLLVIGGFLSKTEAAGRMPPPRPVLGIVEAIRADPDPKFSAEAREALLQVYEAMRSVRSGRALRANARKS